MIILFVHRNFPAQFKNIAIELAKDPNNLVLFLTANACDQLPNVHKVIYTPPAQFLAAHPYLNVFNEAVIHAESAAKMASEIKKRGVKPDVIYGHSFGASMFMKDIFPDVPYLCYFEWYSKEKDSAYDFGGNVLDPEKTAKIKCNNTQMLIDLCTCDAGLSPTKWQKQQFPKEFLNKIRVIHDGIDTEICSPNPNAKFLVKDKNLELTAKDEVITYATRGMEALRGFPQFMEAVEKLQKIKPNAHFIIAGEDKVFYGPPAPVGTYKEYMLNKLNLDMSRVHFVGKLAYEEYLNLLQVSSAHVYMTYPFVLSWSMLESMSCGCCVVASSTQPVLEVIEDKKNGLLFDFFDIDQLVDKILFAIDNKIEIGKIRENARKTVIEKYDKNLLVPKHIEFIKSFINQKK